MTDGMNKSSTNFYRYRSLELHDIYVQVAQTQNSVLINKGRLQISVKDSCKIKKN